MGDIADVFVLQGEIFAVEQRAAEQQEAQTIGAKLVHELVRVGEVTEALAHLAAIVACHDTGGNDVFEGFGTK